MFLFLRPAVALNAALNKSRIQHEIKCVYAGRRAQAILTSQSLVGRHVIIAATGHSRSQNLKHLGVFAPTGFNNPNEIIFRIVIDFI